MVAEYEPSTVLSEEDKKLLVKRLQDPIWRINNLYRITDKKGRDIPFRPNWVQKKIIHAFYILGQKRHIILKARRMGFSTLIDVMVFDGVYWSDDALQASIVDQTQPDASEKLRTKVKFAHEKLPDFMREPLRKSNEKQIEFANGGTVNAGKNARGGTNQKLHISEWGPIAHEDPKRSEEIKTGALPSADQGDIFVESTFKGGKGGHFYEMIKVAMETPEEDKTEKDFHFHFFGWHEDPTNTLEGDVRVIDKATTKYLDEKEVELSELYGEEFEFTSGQRLFYYVTKREQGIFMFREYPTTVEEAFKAPVEGAVYGEILSAIRAKGQIRDFIYDHSYPVWSVWDIGWSDSTSVWLFQVIGREVHWIWHTRQQHKTAAEMWKLVSASEIPVSGTFLPWDADSTAAASGVTYKGELEKAGAENVQTLPPTREMWAGINAARDIMKRSYFHKTNCAAGIDSLEAYHTKNTSSGGTIQKEPVHDWSSHDSDAFRYGCEAIVTGKVRTKQARALDGAIQPLNPDGTETVDVDMIRDARRKRRRAPLAKSGISL